MTLSDPRLFAQRLIVLDVETTGLDARGGDRVVEIGCVELLNCVPSGREFHVYVNPCRPMPPGAEAVHGLSEAFLAGHQPFPEHAHRLIAFLEDCPVIAHNASFDIGFLDHELGRCGHPPLTMTRAIDTLALARARLPGAKHSLDALCGRFGVDLSRRTKHGALLDAQLLAEVYLELIGGRQIGLSLGVPAGPALIQTATTRPRREPRPHGASEAELVRHAAFLARIADPVWAAVLKGADDL